MAVLPHPNRIESSLLSFRAVLSVLQLWSLVDDYELAIFPDGHASLAGEVLDPGIND